MNEFIESSNYHLTRKDENTLISEINNLLKNFETLLKLTNFNDNSRKILDASIICEAMLNLLLKREGYLLKNNASFSEIIIFCTNNKIIPLECSEFIDIIRISQDNIIKGLEMPNDLTLSFLESFMFYISWFKHYYTHTFQPKKEFKTDKCCLLIKHMSDAPKFNSIDSLIKQNIEVSPIKKEYLKRIPKQFKTKQVNEKILNKPPKNRKIFPKHENTKFNFEEPKYDDIEINEEVRIDNSHLSKINQELLLEQLKEQNKSLQHILETVLETNGLVKDINSKLDIIKDNLSRIQSQTTKLIDNAWSEEEIDRIIQVHTSECVDNILEYKSDIIKDNQYNSEAELLELKFNSAWDKLSNDSKNLLVTSKYLYNKLDDVNESVDYSGICVLITKALENEIFKRFFTDFIKYLDDKYHYDYSKYHTALLFQYKEPLIPERFTMGNIAFVLCYTENYYDTPEQIKNNKMELMEYCKSHVFSRYNYDKIEELLTYYASSIEEIRVKYRNPSAHRGSIKKTTAEECFKFVIDVEKLLIKMLDSFDK